MLNEVKIMKKAHSRKNLSITNMERGDKKNNHNIFETFNLGSQILGLCSRKNRMSRRFQTVCLQQKKQEMNDMDEHKYSNREEIKQKFQQFQHQVRQSEIQEESRKQKLKEVLSKIGSKLFNNHQRSFKNKRSANILKKNFISFKNQYSHLERKRMKLKENLQKKFDEEFQRLANMCESIGKQEQKSQEMFQKIIKRVEDQNQKWENNFKLSQKNNNDPEFRLTESQLNFFSNWKNQDCQLFLKDCCLDEQEKYRSLGSSPRKKSIKMSQKNHERFSARYLKNIQEDMITLKQKHLKKVKVICSEIRNNQKKFRQYLSSVGHNFNFQGRKFQTFLNCGDGKQDNFQCKEFKELSNSIQCQIQSDKNKKVTLKHNINKQINTLGEKQNSIDSKYAATTQIPTLLMKTLNSFQLRNNQQKHMRVTQRAFPNFKSKQNYGFRRLTHHKQNSSLSSFSEGKQCYDKIGMMKTNNFVENIFENHQLKICHKVGFIEQKRKNLKQENTSYKGKTFCSKNQGSLSPCLKKIVKYF